jgi:protein O-GlcNAc transferase
MQDGPGVDEVSALWRRVAQSPALAAPWLALARSYAARGLAWQAAYAARQAHRLNPALSEALQGLGIARWQDSASGDALLGRAVLVDVAPRAEAFSAALERHPGDWLTCLYLARLREMQSLPSASQALARARALEPLPGETLHWIGVWRLTAGDAPGAVDALSGLLDIRPVRCGSMMFLGEALLRVGRTAAAEKAFARSSLSANPDFLILLAKRAHACNYWQEAIAVLRKALTIRPDSVPAWLALAQIQSEVYALADCRQSLDRIHTLAPGNTQAALLEAGLHGRCGDAGAHLRALQAAYAAGGDPLSRLASSIAMSSLYDDSLTPGEVAGLHRRLCAPIETAVVRRMGFDNPRLPQRRLRIGFVTGDLHRQHPVNIFMLPVLLRLDHAGFEVCIYHTGDLHDSYTSQARACADRWLEAAGLDDVALQQAIAADGVDILVDLAGHTASHRLGVFAMRAAPVQATFLGYPHSTGLSAMDWLIGDPIVSPAEHAGLFSEGLAQMPHSVFCWSPVDTYPLPPPRPGQGPVVFGSFNNAMKLSPRTLRLWAGVLHAVPDALLLLKAPAFLDDDLQAQCARRFAALGVGPERLTFRGPTALADMMQAYGDIDIALDPTPYNGGTTTLQALWMGVPVLTLAGDNFVARMGASFMSALGQPDWVAADEAGYVQTAARLARECPRLRAGRAHLREQMAASPLCDIDAYVGHMQTLLRRMWFAWCDGGPRRLLRAGPDDAAQA